MNLDSYNQRHTNETAYIIGAGPSIFFQNLKPLKDKLTFAVNSGYCACPWATFFVSDDRSVQNWSYFFRDLYYSRHTTALLYEDKFSDIPKGFNNKTVFFRHRTGYNITEEYEHENYPNRIWQARTSMGTAIHIAYIMGCRRIVLIGNDLCRVQGRRYFWQLYYSGRPYRKDTIAIDTFPRAMMDKHESDVDLLDIMNYWQSISQELNSKCEVLNASKISILDCFPKIELKDII